MKGASKIKAVTIESLNDFFSKVGDFSEQISSLNCRPKNGAGVLYRGQANAEWDLTTTLERCSEGFFSFSKYVDFLKQLTLPTLDFFREIQNSEFEGDFDEIPEKALAAFSYIRHIGGPSPLLDWTEDLDVALFFAFNNIADNVKHVSVYVYLDGVLPGKVHGSISRIPLIHAIPHSRIDSNVTHNNHILQKSQYTYCFLGGGYTDKIFISHEKRFRAIQECPSLRGADLCIKFRLPVRLRQEMFKQLDAKGISEYKLFKTDGAYTRTKWREFLNLNDGTIFKK